ncbi:DUF4190 domain-containing protein [Candidatus Saccharibacteria bacterium]|nr:DUF4190 domain-containing protein [Candidatus Saccharibacteria bacterium]
MLSSTELKPKNYGLAVASLALGILAIPLSFIGIGLILGILAIVFGAVSFKGNKGKSLTGIVTGAIGVLIFILALVLVFIVFPQNRENLQANQRDTQRKNDVGVLVSDVVYSTSENRGQLPDYYYVSDMTYKLIVIEDVIGKTFDGDPIQPTTSTAVYAMGEDCNGNKSTRNFSITILLEDGTKYCQGS